MSIRHPVLILSYVVIPLLSIPGCTITGPPDDGWENSQEWIDNGRLLSNEAKTIYRSNDSPNTGISQNADLNYKAYQEWLQAKESNSAEYQRFKQWQEFETFQRWKEQQKAD